MERLWFMHRHEVASGTPLCHPHLISGATKIPATTTTVNEAQSSTFKAKMKRLFHFLLRSSLDVLLKMTPGRSNVVKTY